MTTQENIKEILSDLGVHRVVREQRFGDYVETRMTYINEQGKRFLPQSDINYDVALAILFSEVDEGEDEDREVKYALTSLDTQSGEITQSYFSLNMYFSLGVPLDFVKEMHGIASNGIDRFTISYEGSDDDGRFVKSSALDNNGQLIPSFSTHHGHDQALDFAYEILSQIEPEWDLGKGSKGTIQFELSSGEVRLHHIDFEQQEERNHSGYVGVLQLNPPTKDKRMDSVSSPRP